MKGSTIYENEKVLFGICVAEVLLGGGTFCFFLICPQWILVIFAVFLACTLGNFILGFRRIRRQVNRTMELVEKLEAEGRIYVIRPMVPTVSRLERDYDKLMSFYEHGYALMKKEYANLLRYMEE